MKDPRPSTFIIRFLRVFGKNGSCRITYCYKKGWQLKKLPPSTSRLIAAPMAMVVPTAISDSHTA